MGKGSSGTRYYLKGGYSLALPPRPVVTSSPSTYTANRPTKSAQEAALRPKGLLNVGNTCYANAALQCLLSTALSHALIDPKASAIFRRYSSNPNILEQGSGSVDSNEDEEQRMTNRDRRQRALDDRAMEENCRWLTRELKSITMEYQHPEPNSAPPSISGWFSPPRAPVVDPGTITRHPHRLSKCLRPYQQEDAHEFLRAMLSTLVMNGQNKQLSSLFDGLLESAVTCLHCLKPSLTRDRYMDLSLDICAHHVETLNDALDEFTKTETLAGDNKVFCQKCDCKRNATKGLRLATAPSILVCHLKRFAFDAYGRLVRLGKKVQVPLRLEIADYMSRVNKARPPPYELVAVLVHQGSSCDSGHYLAYVKNNGLWYKCNDSQVDVVEVSTVLDQQAYIVLYEVEEMRSKTGYSSPGPSSFPKIPTSANTDDWARHLSGWREYLTSNSLCGMDDTLLHDFCWGGNPHRETGSTAPRRRRRRDASNRSMDTQDAHDDLSTLGESTVESSDSKVPFRRISSSGNLKAFDRYRHTAAHSAGRARQFLKDNETQAAWTSNSDRVRRRDMLPPRSDRSSHRRALSSGLAETRTKEA